MPERLTSPPLLCKNLRQARSFYSGFTLPASPPRARASCTAHTPPQCPDRPSGSCTSPCLLVYGGAWQSSASGFIHATSRVLRFDLESEGWQEIFTRGRSPEARLWQSLMLICASWYVKLILSFTCYRYRHASCIVRETKMAMWGGYVLRARIPQRPVFTTGDVQETYASMNAGVLPSALVLVCYLG